MDHNFGDQSVWDYPFVLHILMNNGLGVVPKVNMIRNIGFGEISTHTPDPFNKEAFYMDSEMDFPLIHPKFIVPTPRINDPYDLPANKEDRDREIKERKAHFENLVAQKDYLAILEYFNDMLRNAKKLDEFESVDNVLTEYLNKVDMKNIEVGRIKNLNELPLPVVEEIEEAQKAA